MRNRWHNGVTVRYGQENSHPAGFVVDLVLIALAFRDLYRDVELHRPTPPWLWPPVGDAASQHAAIPFFTGSLGTMTY
jgi:hypothetical protein